jgi:hypothetical protein
MRLTFVLVKEDFKHYFLLSGFCDGLPKGFIPINKFPIVNITNFLASYTVYIKTYL